MLILDEGTSALDSLTESAVLKALAASRAKQTILMVAHCLSTLRDADRILVFSQGRIVEEGPYEVLIKAGGPFSEMVQSGNHYNTI